MMVTVSGAIGDRGFEIASVCVSPCDQLGTATVQDTTLRKADGRAGVHRYSDDRRRALAEHFLAARRQIVARQANRSVNGTPPFSLLFWDIAGLE